jgi:murein DD-endopeptidase MepM/ murein hydrolase activator NlpD
MARNIAESPAALSRSLGHLTVALLIAALIWNLPGMLRIPRLGELIPLSTATSTSAGLTSGVSTEAADDAHYLEQAAVPLTARVIRDVLPLVEPRTAARTSVVTYRVQPGDTVLGIATKFGLQGTSLLWANEDLDANPDFLTVGQQLFILPIDGVYYTVSRGDTLASIAKQFKVDEAAITGYAANGIADGTLSAGQRVVIPGGTKPETQRASPVATYSNMAPAPEDAQTGSGAFAWPLRGTLSQGYWAGHRAIDLAVSTGTPVASADAGYVSLVQSSNYGYGKMVIVDHGNGYQTLYAHLSKISVEPGQSVARGEIIGSSGSTGNSTGPHLHFEVIKNGVRTNPLGYLP